MEITKATTMGEMLQYDMGIAYILMEAGMHCVYMRLRMKLEKILTAIIKLLLIIRVKISLNNK